MTTTTAAPVTTSQAGAIVVAALGEAYEAIRVNHPELPEHVMFVTGTGMDGRGLRWGHFLSNGWVAAPQRELRRVAGGRVTVRIATGARVHEVFVSGERLAEGATLTFQTLLHESVHALADTRGVKDCNNGRHLREFKDLAESMGLEYTHGAAHKSLGYSQVTLTSEARQAYAGVIERLATAIVTYLDTFKRLGMTIAANGGTEGRTSVVKRAPQGKDRNYLACECGCGHKLRMSRSMVERQIVRCDDCGELFASVTV